MTKVFARFVRDERVEEANLCDAVARADVGLIDANLGGGIIKQRVARRGSGRSGGYRTIIAYRMAHRSVFLYGFAKNERDNVNDRELADLKKLAKHYLSYDDAQLAAALASLELKEVNCDEQS